MIQRQRKLKANWRGVEQISSPGISLPRSTGTRLKQECLGEDVIQNTASCFFVGLLNAHRVMAGSRGQCYVFSIFSHVKEENNKDRQRKNKLCFHYMNNAIKIYLGRYYLDL